MEAFIAAARHQPHDALRHARVTLACAIPPISINCVWTRWAWPLAARTSHDLRDIATTRELLALLDAHQSGSLAPILRAERALVHARLAADEGDRVAVELLVSAVASLREHSTPYHLAHGLLDHAAYLTSNGDNEAAAAVIGEARDIAQLLRCQPLLDRAEAIQPVRPRTAAS